MVLVVFAVNQFFPDFIKLTDFRMISSMREEWRALYLSRPAFYLSAFFLFNILMAMLPVPGISMISLLGGALFGFYWGFGLSSLATALGNLGGFYIARFLLRDWVMQKYGEKVKIFQKDWQTNGALALFSMRLFPLVPSFVANLIMGVSPLKAWTFFWVGWVGRIPMVLFYTLAGVQIGSINSLDDIITMPVIISFALLALAPWGGKYLLQKYKS